MSTRHLHHCIDVTSSLCPMTLRPVSRIVHLRPTSHHIGARCMSRNFCLLRFFLTTTTTSFFVFSTSFRLLARSLARSIRKAVFVFLSVCISDLPLACASYHHRRRICLVLSDSRSATFLWIALFTTTSAVESVWVFQTCGQRLSSGLRFKKTTTVESVFGFAVSDLGTPSSRLLPPTTHPPTIIYDLPSTTNPTITYALSIYTTP
jgi:hypothetical protein